jgi:phosphatidylethanolamine-binding protein (PEBP) family uncharacterized protein
MPPLKWTDAPDAAKSFALIVEDPDAPNGMFRHLGSAVCRIGTPT